MKQVFQKLTGRKGYNNQHKMCPHCGKFVEESDVTCPYCQGSVGHIRVFKERATVKSDGQVETTWLLMGICMFFYLLQAMKTVDLMNLGISDLPQKSVFSAYWNPNALIALLMGSNRPALTWTGEFWRLIQYMFLHGGIIHMGFNLYALAALGPYVNKAFGIRRFWVTILLTGIFGGVASSLSLPLGLVREPSIGSIGVSGALFGLIGVMYAYFKSDGNFMAAARFKKIMINANVLCFIISIFMPIDNLAHLGGMFTGIGIGFVMYRFAASQWLIQVERATLLLCGATWIWGLIKIYDNLTHLKDIVMY